MLAAATGFAKAQGCASSAMRHLTRVKALPCVLGALPASPPEHIWEAAASVSVRSDGPLHVAVCIGASALDAASFGRVSAGVEAGGVRASALQAVSDALLAPCELDFTFRDGGVALFAKPALASPGLERVLCNLASDGAGELLVDAAAACVPVLRVVTAALGRPMDGALGEGRPLPANKACVLADGAYALSVPCGGSQLHVHALGGRRVCVSLSGVPDAARAGLRSSFAALGLPLDASSTSVWPTSFASLFECVQVAYCALV